MIRKNKKKAKPNIRIIFLALLVILFALMLLDNRQNAVSEIKLAVFVSPTPTEFQVTTPTITPPSAEPTEKPAQAQIQLSKTDNGFCLAVPILMYHHIEPLDQAKQEGHSGLTVDSTIFDQQMDYLTKQGYRTISSEELANALVNHQQLGKVAMITVDDGYSDIYSYAYPVAKKYNIILNLMIPTGLIENPGYMTWTNLKEMTSGGLVYAYDHTWSHYSMARGDPQKEETEIMTAKKQLEENLGKTVDIFAYPYGSSNQQSIDILQRNGFKAAFTTIPGFYQCDSFILGLHRNRIGNAPLSSYGL